MKAITLQMSVALVLLINCASAPPKSNATPESSKQASCGIEGFTKSPSEHIVVQLEEPFRVRSVEGAITSQGGDWPKGASVLIELRPARGASRMRPAKTDAQGLFRIPGVAPGDYCVNAHLELTH